MDVLRSDMGKLTRSEQDFRRVIESAPIAMVMASRDGGIELFNAEAERIFGYLREEVYSKPVELLMAERFREAHQGFRAGYFQAPGARAMGEGRELFARRKDGSEFPVEIGLVPIPMNGGTWVLATVLDISVRKRAEQALAESEERFRTLADNMSQFAWMADEKGQAFWFNHRWFEFTGASLEEMQGWGWTTVLHPDHLERVVERVQKSWDTGEPWEDTFPLRGKDGRYRWFLSRALPIRDGSGRVARWFGTNTDITEQKLAEEALRGSEATLNAVLETLPVGVVIADLNGAIIRDNAATRELWGVPPETTSWRNYGEWVAWRPATGERIQAHEWAMARALLHGEETRNELIQNRRFDSDERRFFLNNVAPLRNPGGRIIGAVAAMFDVTEQRAAEDALRESERRISTLVANLPGMAYRCRNSPQWPMEFMSDRVKELTGYPAQDFYAGRVNYGEIIHPEDQDLVWRSVQAGVTGKQPFTMEYRIRHADGSERWVWEQGSGVFNDADALVALEGFIVETTERKRAEQSLRESEERFRGTFETAAVGIAHVALDGRWLRVNDKLCQIVGYTREELLTMTFGELTHPDDLEADWERARRLVAGEIPSYSADKRYTHRNGNIIWIALNVSLARRPDGEPDYFISVIRDITTRKHLEQSLRDLSDNLTRQVEERTRDLIEARDAAEAANRAKSEFLANMSHEIRTPMNGVFGMTELLLRTPLTSEQRHYLDLVRQSADSLLVLINDILDFSKIEAGKLELFPVEFDLRDTLGATLQSLGHRAGEKGLELAYRVAPDVPPCLVGDAGRLRQIMINLVGNAVKFSESGEIVVEVLLDSRENRHAKLHFQVRDSGCGIPAEKLETIFQPFTQGDSSAQRRFGGTGLGLSISRQLAGLMGGQIWVDSVVGSGTTVHFTARLGVSERSGVVTCNPPESLHGLRVMVADDSAANREILEEILRSWHMRPVMARNGAEVLERLETQRSAGEGSDAEAVRLVLLDMVMPDMDGERVVQEIHERFGKAAPKMLILSSLGQMIPVRKLHDLGITRLLTKPVRASQLLDAIIWTLGTAQGDEGRPQQTSSGRALRRLRVLLAEDNAVNRQVAVRLLEDRGHSVVAVEDGTHVLRAIESEQFDAVLMDVQMPEMDGITAARKIRERERMEGQPRIPIIALTADAMQADRERCLQAGMDGYVAKPVRSAELYAALEHTLPNTVMNDPAPPPPAPVDAGFDREAFRAAMEDPQLMREMIEAFAEDAARWLTAGEAAVAAEDIQGLHRAAHALKGMIGNFTTAGPYQRVCELNELTRNGCFTPEMAASFLVARQQVALLKGELEELRTELATSAPP